MSETKLEMANARDSIQKMERELAGAKERAKVGQINIDKWSPILAELHLLQKDGAPIDQARIDELAFGLETSKAALEEPTRIEGEIKAAKTAAKKLAITPWDKSVARRLKLDVEKMPLEKRVCAVNVATGVATLFDRTSVTLFSADPTPPAAKAPPPPVPAKPRANEDEEWTEASAN